MNCLKYPKNELPNETNKEQHHYLEDIFENQTTLLWLITCFESHSVSLFVINTMMTDQSQSMETQPHHECTPRSLIEYYYYYGWNRNNANVMKEILDENVKFRGGLARVDGKVSKYRGRNGLLQYMHDAHTAIANKRCEIMDIIVDSSSPCAKAAVRVKVHGRFQEGSARFFGVDASAICKTKQMVEILYNASAFFTFNETCDKIIAVWIIADIDSLKNQLGATVESRFDG